MRARCSPKQLEYHRGNQCREYQTATLTLDRNRTELEAEHMIWPSQLGEKNNYLKCKKKMTEIRKQIQQLTYYQRLNSFLKYSHKLDRNVAREVKKWKHRCQGKGCERKLKDFWVDESKLIVTQGPYRDAMAETSQGWEKLASHSLRKGRIIGSMIKRL